MVGADLALYEAKDQRPRTGSPSTASREEEAACTADPRRLVAADPHGLDEDLFVPYLQPIMSLQDRASPATSSWRG